MNFKKTATILLVFLMAFSIVGCGGEKDNKGDHKTVIAQVNGENITRDKFIDSYNVLKANYYITEDMEDDPEQEDMIMELKLNLVDQMVMEKVVEQKAKEAGFEVTEDSLSKAHNEFEDIIFNLSLQMKEMDEFDEGEGNQGEDGEAKDYKKEAEDYIDNEIKNMGETRDSFIRSLAQGIIINDFIDSLIEDVEADEREINDYYKERLQSQRDNISSIKYDNVELFSPEEVRVKHILIGISGEDTDRYFDLKDEGKEDEAKEFLEEKLEEIEPRAKEILDKAKNGQEFEALIDEYGDDPGMVDNPAGYMVRQDGDFLPEFEEAAFKLEVEEISDLVITDFGFHIIKLYEKYPQRVFSLEETYDDIKEVLDYQKRSDAWGTILDDWMDNAQIEVFEDRL